MNFKPDEHGYIEIPYECPDCNGTGVFRGMCERGSAGIVCTGCNGTGKRIFRGKVFTERQLRTDVKRVYDATYGYVITDMDVYTNDDHSLIEFSKYGSTYEEWLAGADPIPIKDLVCPYQADARGYGYGPLKRCENLHAGSSYSACLFYKDKAKCWRDVEKQVR